MPSGRIYLVSKACCQDYRRDRILVLWFQQTQNSPAFFPLLHQGLILAHQHNASFNKSASGSLPCFTDLIHSCYIFERKNDTKIAPSHQKKQAPISVATSKGHSRSLGLVWCHRGFFILSSLVMSPDRSRMDFPSNTKMDIEQL